MNYWYCACIHVCTMCITALNLSLINLFFFVIKKIIGIQIQTYIPVSPLFCSDAAAPPLPPLSPSSWRSPDLPCALSLLLGSHDCRLSVPPFVFRTLRSPKVLTWTRPGIQCHFPTPSSRLRNYSSFEKTELGAQPTSEAAPRLLRRIDKAHRSLFDSQRFQRRSWFNFVSCDTASHVTSAPVIRVTCNLIVNEQFCEVVSIYYQALLLPTVESTECHSLQDPNFSFILQ